VSKDLGVKATIEFVAEGQEAVTAAAEKSRHQISAMAGSWRLLAGAVGAGAMVVHTLRDIWMEAARTADQFNRLTVATNRSLDGIVEKLKEVKTDHGKIAVLGDITRQITDTQLALDELQTKFMERGVLGAGKTALREIFGGADPLEMEWKALTSRLDRLQSLKDIAVKARVEWDLTELDDARRRLAEFREQAVLSLALDSAGDDLQAQQRLLDARLAELEVRRQLAGMVHTVGGDPAAEVAAVKTKLQLEQEILELRRASLRLAKEADQQQLDALLKLHKEQKEPPRPITAPPPRIHFDRLTQVGATLGDPGGLKGPGNLGRGKDPAYYMEEANRIAKEMLAEMKANRRRNYDEEAAYAD
jgi:hypothetical protein